MLAAAFECLPLGMAASGFVRLARVSSVLCWQAGLGIRATPAQNFWFLCFQQTLSSTGSSPKSLQGCALKTVHTKHQRITNGSNSFASLTRRRRRRRG